MNRVILGGTIDNDPATRAVGDKTVGEFRIDTGSGWFTVTAWENLAANLPPKGTYVVVEGRLRTRSYEKDGEKRYITEVNASNIDVVNGTMAVAEPRDDLGFD